MAAKRSSGPSTPQLDREYGVCRGCGHGATTYQVIGAVTWFVCTPCRRAWPRVARFTDVLSGCRIDAAVRRHGRHALKALRRQRAELDTYIQALEATT